MVSKITGYTLIIAAGVWTLSMVEADADDTGRIVSLECSDMGVFTHGHRWHLIMTGSGKAELTVWVGGKPVKRELSTNSSIKEIEWAIKRYRFFELPEEIGSGTPDDNTRTLRIKTTKREKSVSIRQVRKEALGRDSRDAISLWKVVRDSFDDRNAHDGRKYDNWLLEESTRRR
jgi:hypothetical protein